MKKSIPVLFILCFAIAKSQTYPDEITRTKIIVDSVINTGKHATANFHWESPRAREHKWNWELLEWIPNEKFIADDRKGIRVCNICGRKEAVHDTTWSERVRKKK